VTHLLVTNDYPPKIGGIQSYLFELWRRLDPETFVVLTTGHKNAASFDPTAGHKIIRIRSRLMLPTSRLRAHIMELAKDTGASLIVLDPALPVGLLGPSLGLPYALVLHGAEVTVPARMPALRQLLRKTIVHASLVIAAGDYPAAEASRVAGDKMPQVIRVPPGVDAARFAPLSPELRNATRRRLGLEERAQVVFSVSRLVPRKGMDVLIEASAELASEFPELRVLVGGTGRDDKRLAKLASRLSAPVTFLGRLSEEELPQIYGAADIFAMLCRNRWLGLEQEGFGIVFLEAAATGIAQVAGRSGGAPEAVIDHKTGLVVDRPGDVVVCTEALRTLLEDEELRLCLGSQALLRARTEFAYERLAGQLSEALLQAGG
jgi:phosphatidylinositol alpha-1,6-mannosyltransferase